MSWVSGIAIYFIIWWTVLFVVLPFGVRNAHETGIETVDGHDAGAPVLPRLLWKVVVTTILSGVVFLAIVLLVQSGLVDLNTLPFYRDMPSPV